MTPWTRIPEVRSRLLKKWDRGTFLPQVLTPDAFEPLRIPLKHPASGELTREFDRARTWIAKILKSAGKTDPPPFHIEWKQVNHRTLGKNKIPKALIFYDLACLLSFLGKTRDAQTYHTLFTRITGQFPELTLLLKDRPMEVLAHEAVWDKLLCIITYLSAAPRPGIYIRQLEIPGVDTKFIQAHKAFLTRLLTAVLPEDTVDATAKGAAGFERRFGFKSKPARIRLRSLDPELTIMGLTDLEIPVQDFNHLPICPETVFIVENEISGLAFPDFPNAMVILGLGYGLSALAGAQWMTPLPIWYWSDLDTDGFAMLNQLRRHFPQTRSLLMDQATLLAHKALWGKDPKPAIRDLPLLTPEEAAVYQALKQNLYAPQLRLEQERISFKAVRKAVDLIRNSTATPSLFNQ